MDAIRLGGLLLAWSILFSLPAVADEPAGELKKRIQAELTTFYTEGEPVPPWKQAIEAVSRGADDSAAAGTYLRALLAQAAEDEASGLAPWRATPYWGSRGENPARNLREAITESLAKQQSLTDDATPAIAWVLENEKVPAFQRDAAIALKATRGEEADRLIASLLSAETSNHAVLQIAIEMAADRPSLRDRGPVIAQLATHHHSKIRESAERVAKAMGIEQVPVFDATAAMRSKPVASLMKRMSNYVDLPPADARFVSVTKSYPQREGDPYVTTASGWEVQRDETTIVLFSPHGSTQSIRLKPDPEADPDELRAVVSIEQIRIEDEVARIEQLRSGGDDRFKLSEQGGLTGQFEGRGASVYEAILGLWLYEGGQDKLAARIILPALDTLYADHYLAEMVRQRMGRNIGRQMLVAFIGERDYEAATRHAKRIVERFPNTQFHSDAVSLAAELPKRADDFKALTLPTPAEWAKLKDKLSRGEQIDYLCVRLRLLNVYQWGQPGGISYTQTQWPTPQGLSADAAWGGSYREDLDGALINPYTELTGETGWGHPKGEPEPVGMKLTVDDIPRLADHLREDWHILAVSFWRDFHPDRSLHTTREIIIDVIDGLASDTLVDVGRLTDEKTT